MTVDIETSPNIGIFWQPGYKISIGPENIVEERKVICICWKYLGQKKIHSLHWNTKTQDDKEMLKKFIKEINKADLVIAHNGDKFDIPRLQARAIYHGLPPISGILTTDTLKLVRSNFGFNSNKLDYICSHLGIGGKLQHAGLDLWKNVVLHNSQKDLKHMIKYCKRDVEMLEQLFVKILPYIKNLPTSMSLLFNKDREACPRCAHRHVIKHGKYTTKAGKYQKYQCNKCAHIFKDTKMIKDVDTKKPTNVGHIIKMLGK